MNSRKRLLTALEGGVPDRLPVTTHHVMPWFLDTYLDGVHYLEFFEQFDLDPTLWIVAHIPDESKGGYNCPFQPEPGFLEPFWVCSYDWRIELETPVDQGSDLVRYRIDTPGGNLSTVLRSSPQTAWVVERLVKEKGDIELIERYAPVPLCDVEEVNRKVEESGDRGIVRGTVAGFDIYGQPGCWQDAAVLFGIEELIMATFDDPMWVRELLEILKRRKVEFIRSMAGARFDLIELGGGDASSSVISPQIFEEFVAPFDAELVEEAHKAGQKVVYHTCGGMMPILEMIADMGPDAMETFTPPSLGGDVDLAEAKRRIGDRVCMIGGFDQSKYFVDCDPDETRRAVRDCFSAAGSGGGYILSPSDHFFDADPDLIRAFADEAAKCVYRVA